MGDIHNTQYFGSVQENKLDVSQVLEQVYIALTRRRGIIRSIRSWVISCLEILLILPVIRTPEVSS